MLINSLPQASPQFAPSWVAEFVRELENAALQRVRVVLIVLCFLELGLLLQDSYRTNWFHGGLDDLTVWRLITMLYLLVYLSVASKFIRPTLRLRSLLILGVLIGAYGTVVLSRQVGDLSIFAIVLLGIAAASPLPGRFNAVLFIMASAGLLAWLWWKSPIVPQEWLANIVATCVVSVAIQKLTYTKALEEFTQRKQAGAQRQELDQLLHQVFPASVAESLKQGLRPVATHAEVTILFADVVGFSRLSKQLLPTQLVAILEELFKRFDDLALRHGVEKIKTVGDAYMAVAGAPEAVEAPVHRMARFGLDMIKACQAYARERDLPLELRVGIHCGPAVAGVIGSARLCYDLWGDAVNTAKRIESSGQVSAVCVSEQVYYQLRDAFDCESRGLMQAKGIGAIQTYVLRGEHAT